jgi:hypothetical protein
MLLRTETVTHFVDFPLPVSIHSRFCSWPSKYLFSFHCVPGPSKPLLQIILTHHTRHHTNQLSKGMEIITGESLYTLLSWGLRIGIGAGQYCTHERASILLTSSSTASLCTKAETPADDRLQSTTLKSRSLNSPDPAKPDQLPNYLIPFDTTLSSSSTLKLRVISAWNTITKAEEGKLHVQRLGMDEAEVASPTSFMGRQWQCIDFS